jgi:hypothetical protein
MIGSERMPALPWRTFLAPDPAREYLALLSFLPLKHYRKVPKFLWLSYETHRQLTRSKGLIGYSLLAQPLRRNFWTLSVWEDQQSLMDFVRQIPHSRIMQALAPHMGKTQFVHWKLPATGIPPAWNDALARMN